MPSCTTQSLPCPLNEVRAVYLARTHHHHCEILTVDLWLSLWLAIALCFLYGRIGGLGTVYWGGIFHIQIHTQRRHVVCWDHDEWLPFFCVARSILVLLCFLPFCIFHRYVCSILLNHIQYQNLTCVYWLLNCSWIMVRLSVLSLNSSGLLLDVTSQSKVHTWECNNL